MHYESSVNEMRCALNIDLNWENIIRKAFPKFMNQIWNAFPPLEDLEILGTIRSPEICDLKECDGL